MMDGVMFLLLILGVIAGICMVAIACIVTHGAL